MKKHFLLAMLLIAAMMLVPGIESCVDDPANTDISVTTVANIEDTTTDNNPEPALPESDFGGESFMFLLRLTNYAYDETPQTRSLIRRRRNTATVSTLIPLLWLFR